MSRNFGHSPDDKPKPRKRGFPRPDLFDFIVGFVSAGAFFWWIS